MENMLGLPLQKISVLSLGHLFGLNLLCCTFVFTHKHCHNSTRYLSCTTDDCVLSEIQKFIVLAL